MSEQVQVAVSGERSRPEVWLLRPTVLMAVVAVVALAGAMLPKVAGYGAYGQQEIDQQIDREDSALCEKFQFAAGTMQHAACKADLADLRLRHERLLLR